MDNDLMKAIGPYGKKFIATASSSTLQNGIVLTTPKIAALRKPVIKPISTGKTTAAPPVSKAPSKPATNFEAFYKKSNVKFLQGPESKRNDRQAEMEVHRKAKRSEALMAKRKVNLKDTSTAPTPNNKRQVPANSKDVKVTTISPLSLITRSDNKKNIVVQEMNENDKAVPIITDSRREQLLKWKKEKEVMENGIKAAKKPPFKPNGPPVLANKTTGNPLPAGINSTIGQRANNTRPNTAIKTTAILSSKPSTQQTSDKLQGNERRVTRAMAKAQTVAKPYNDVGTKAEAVKPAIKAMKNLNLNGNSGSKNVEKPTLVSGKTGNQKGQVKIGSKGKKTSPLTPEVVNKDSQITNSNIIPEPAQTLPLTVNATGKPTKKLKPKGIDSVYISHNANFAKACEILGAYQNYWKDVVEASGIPEDIRDDIISALGKVKLLLDSKLPQFGELLYSYLCKEMNPGLILECDLEGWWDVASIQMTLIQAEFSGLKDLQNNNWIREPVIVVKLPQKTKSKSNEVATPKTPAKPKVARPTKGIQAFLAEKRKLQAQEAEKGRECSKEKEIKEQDTPVKLIEPLDKQFQGGFFMISSPAKAIINKRPSRRMTERGNLSLAFNTPTSQRRNSSVSLKMLSVRNSMGSICKIGVPSVLAFSSPQDENISEKSEPSYSTEEKMDMTDMSADGNSGISTNSKNDAF